LFGSRPPPKLPVLTQRIQMNQAVQMTIDGSKAANERGDPFACSFATSYAGVLAFIAVVNEGSFAKAADRLGIGRSAVSRSVQRLESQLSARLFHRTTRSTSLTSEGEVFFARCQPGVMHIAQALEDMRELRQGPPRGCLRVSSTSAFGRKVVAPLLAGFNEFYPDISLELLLDDGPADLIASRIDVSFRNGRLQDSEVVAKLLVPMRMLVCASPDYARVHGLPQSIDELAGHRAIHLRLPSGRVCDWEFKVDGRPQRTVPPGRAMFNDDDLVLQAVLAGQGLAQLAAYQVCTPLSAGRVLTCLEGYAPDDLGHYICYLSRQQLPPRIRVFVDYMTHHIRQQYAQSLDLTTTLAA
jgi:DNA-binding transcriptional LysR family regulator